VSKRLMIGVGGTGGHIYPALALAQQISLKDSFVEPFFIGGRLADNIFFKKMEFPFENISCSSFVFKNPLKLLSGLNLNAKGIYQSIKAIKKFQPQLIVGFGSYHSFPTMVAAQLCGLPIILMASDIHPGKVIRLFSRFSMITAIQFDEAAALLKGKKQRVNIPLRPGHFFHFRSKKIFSA
jgi:UDP-N-acetylglucosamine--N-acetylmuramyl-(pentapeptide) pyrophosphoryl-undecaprenol N-acetylglucosamine transferase